MSKTKYFLWDKSRIAKVLELWGTHTTEEIALEIGCSTANVSYLAHRIRKISPNSVPKKLITGNSDSLIKSVLAERGIAV